MESRDRKTEPWRSKLTKHRRRRSWSRSARVREWLTELTDTPLLASEIGAVGNIKALIQAEAENKAAIRKLKKEGRDLAALEKRTDEQKARSVRRVLRGTGRPRRKQESIASDL
jgi:hypothetical protein